MSALVLGLLAAVPDAAQAETGQRTLVVRERAVGSLLDGAFTFKVLKLRGYSVDVRIDGEKRLLKKGQSFALPDAGCSVTFKKISPETRIARFLTDCP